MAKTTKKLKPMKRTAIDFGYTDEADRSATSRLIERLSKPDDGRTYFAVNRTGWSSSTTGLRGLADKRQSEPTHSSQPSAHDAPDGCN